MYLISNDWKVIGSYLNIRYMFKSLQEWMIFKINQKINKSNQIKVTSASRNSRLMQEGRKCHLRPSCMNRFENV